MSEAVAGEATINDNTINQNEAENTEEEGDESPLAEEDASSSNSNVVSSITDVTKENFIDQSNDLIQRISNAAWIAVDEEMTGINLPNTPRPCKSDTPADRYSTLKKVPERYSIIQLGLCLFEEAGITATPDGGERMSFHVVRFKDRRGADEWRQEHLYSRE